MQIRAAVAHKAGAPLTIERVQLEGPRAGEVLVEIKATGLCHTDEFTRSGVDPGSAEISNPVHLHRSMTTSRIGCEQQTRRLPSAGFSSGSGP
jgi:threonine dehydrogenase-like Zn-dependent dehydrogenase